MNHIFDALAKHLKRFNPQCTVSRKWCNKLANIIIKKSIWEIIQCLRPEYLTTFLQQNIDPPYKMEGGTLELMKQSNDDSCPRQSVDTDADSAHRHFRPHYLYLSRVVGLFCMWTSERGIPTLIFSHSMRYLSYSSQQVESTAFEDILWNSWLWSNRLPTF